MRRHSNREAGQDLVEFAMILPLFLLLSLGVIESSLLFFQYSAIANAAREGARAGIVMPNQMCDQACLDAHAETVARSRIIGLNQSELHVAVEHPAADLITVVVTYDSGFITRMAAGATGQDDFAITLQSASTMRRER